MQLTKGCGKSTKMLRLNWLGKVAEAFHANLSTWRRSACQCPGCDLDSLTREEMLELLDEVGIVLGSLLERDILVEGALTARELWSDILYGSMHWPACGTIHPSGPCPNA